MKYISFYENTKIKHANCIMNREVASNHSRIWKHVNPLDKGHSVNQKYLSCILNSNISFPLICMQWRFLGSKIKTNVLTRFFLNWESAHQENLAKKMKKSPGKDGMNCNFNKVQVDISLIYHEVVCNGTTSYRSTFCASRHSAELTPSTNAPLSWQLSSYLMVVSGLSTGSASTC